MPRAYGVTNAAPYASAPPVGAAGDTYFNTTSKTLFLSDGTSWIQVQGGSGSTQTLGSSGMSDLGNTPSATWIDWGILSIPTTSVAVGAVNTTVFVMVTGFGTNFATAASATFSIRVACSFDGGTTWSFSPQVDETPIGQTGTPIINRSPIAQSYAFTQAAATTGQVRVKAQFNSAAPAGNMTAQGGNLTWMLPVGGVGPTGPVGPQGPAGTGVASAFTARGEWASATTYNPLEIVTRNGVAFLAMSASTNVDPGTIPAGSFAAISDLQGQITAIGRNLPWTPVMRQGVVISTTIRQAWYSRVGEWVIGVAQLVATSAGTNGQQLSIDYPVPPRDTTSGPSVGAALLYNGASNLYGNVYLLSQGIGFAQGATVYVTQVAIGHVFTVEFMYLAPVGV